MQVTALSPPRIARLTGMIAALAMLSAAGITAGTPPRAAQAARVPAVVAKSRTPRCAMKGKTILRTSQLRVVRVVRRVETEDGGVGSATTLRACAFSANRVRTLGSAVDGEYVQQGIALEKHAGTWLSFVTSETAGRVGSAYAVHVLNARTGTRYGLFHSSTSVIPGAESPASQSMSAYFLNDLGQVAAAIDDLESQAGSYQMRIVRTHIVAVSSRGSQREVDSGAPEELPSSSLFLDRRLFIWLHSGAVRYALLS